MKKILLAITVTLSFGLSAQSIKKIDVDSAAKYNADTTYASLTKKIKIIEKDTTRVLSWPAFNLLAAKTMATYLSNSSDFSMSKAYGVLDNTDGKLYVGGNIPLRCCKTKKLWGMVTLGAKSNVTDKISEIFNKEKIANDVSGEIKLTFLMCSSLKFDKDKNQSDYTITEDKPKGGQRSKMIMVRKRLLQEDKIKTQKDIEDMIKTLYSDGKENIDSTNFKILKDKLASIQEDIEDNFYAEEEEAFAKSPRKYSNSQSILWSSFSGSIPVSETKYSIAESYKIAPHDFNYYPISGSAKITWLYNNFKYIKWFLNLSYTSGKSNTLLDSAIDQSTITSTTKLDSSSVINTTSKAYYSSSGFKQYSTNKLRGQVVIYPDPSKNKYVGFDFFADLSLDKSKNNATWGIGIPISLKDKDDKPLVNFELIYDKLNYQTKNRIIRVSLSLPFSSLIY